jgi:hypothetical protein
MAFKNEVVSDADIDRYNLPFQKGDGRWWTRDAERDFYLWGGISGNPAYGEEQEGRFYLYFKQQLHLVIIQTERADSKINPSSHDRKWESISRIIPDPLDETEERNLLSVLKEALFAYGFDGQDDAWSAHSEVQFDF